MTQLRNACPIILILAVATALASNGPTARAFEEADPLEAATSTGVPATGEKAADPQGDPAGNSLLDDGQLLASYECSPTRENCYRACLVGPSGMYWARADYLLWWTRGARVVPLVTTSNTQDGGVIGADTTSILFGGERVNGDSRSNFRINFGWWFHCGRTAGIEFDYFTLGETGDDFRFASSDRGQPLYARPFFDVNPEVIGTPRENAELVSDPRFLRGTVDGRIDEYFHSAGANLRLNLLCNMPCGDCCGEGCDDSCEPACEPDTCEGGDCGELCHTRAAAYCRGLSSLREKLQRTCYRVDFIAGYRHYQLNDSLRVHEDLVTFDVNPFDPRVAIGTTYEITDNFRSRNEFHGGELGLIAQFFRGCWSLELLAKMALGNNSQVVTIDGQSIFQAPGDEPAPFDAGILALETNSGRHTHNDFVVIPQFGAEIGYQINCHLRTFVGYNFIYWANVARASEQIDYTLNSSYFPGGDEPPVGEARPQFVWNDSDFWAQGINVGAEYRF